MKGGRPVFRMGGVDGPSLRSLGWNVYCEVVDVLLS
jgi:hypothetical protein